MPVPPVGATTVSLSAIVNVLGGDLYDRGRRAVIPGPGHSRHDRSVSLLLTEGRLVVHSFGRSTWREVLCELRARGLIDANGSPAGGSGPGWVKQAHLSLEERRQTAAALWGQAAPLTRQLALRHARLRGVDRKPPVSDALRHHQGAPLAVYAGRGPSRPALLAVVSDAQGDLCAVEVTYLDPSGHRACGLSLSRKVIGSLPPSCSVHLDAPGPELLVGEGVFTTLSASARFSLPGWALLSARNLRTWSPPAGVRQVLIAGDRGAEGERSARLLRSWLDQAGVKARVAWPPAPANDWNEAVTGSQGLGKEETAEAGAPSGRMVPSPAQDTT